jgi:hypothetical protein
MKIAFGISLMLAALATTAYAQVAVEMIQTNGIGEVRRVAEVMISPGSRNASARLPGTIRNGDVIAIQYQTAGGSLSDTFQVTGISISGDRCAIESKHHNAEGMELIDVIVTQPCARLK